MKRSAVFIFAAFLVLAVGPAAGEQHDGNDAYYGSYQVTPDHLIGIDRFTTDAGENAVLISDYQSGVVRRLYPVSDTEFVMGPGFDVKAPPELTVVFVKDASGNVTGISLQPTNETASFAKRMPLTIEEVTIPDGPVKLAGTLILPATKGLHPANILLHGSGPLTRASFGPYPYFFASLGFAVLIYDKRGTGASTGALLDASTGALSQLSAEHYPDGLTDDALAAFRFLQNRREINSREIGFWGSSEGGMLATQVAARNQHVAFAINSSGFMGPLWQTLLYQVGPGLRRYNVPAGLIDEAIAHTKLWMRVARTGEDYELFLRERAKARAAKQAWLFSWTSDQFTSLEQMRWDWDHILISSPLPHLAKVKCPVLGVFGELDDSTQASVAAGNMRHALAKAGNKDVTVRIFPNAGHSLALPSGDRMAPGVFATLRDWLLQRVQIDERARRKYR